jgi:hypothetical protein
LNEDIILNTNTNIGEDIAPRKTTKKCWDKTGLFSARNKQFAIGWLQKATPQQIKVICGPFSSGNN